MKKELTCVSLLCVAVICLCQTSKASVSDINKPKYDFKHPTDWLELGGDFRFRYMYDNNRKLQNNAPGHDRS